MLIEPIETRPAATSRGKRAVLTDEWLLQRPLLKPRVDAADAAYEQLLIAREVTAALVRPSTDRSGTRVETPGAAARARRHACRPERGD